MNIKDNKWKFLNNSNLAGLNWTRNDHQSVQFTALINMEALKTNDWKGTISTLTYYHSSSDFMDIYLLMDMVISTSITGFILVYL